LENALTLAQVAELVGGRLEGDGALEITGVASLELAGEGDLAALGRTEAVHKLKDCRAAALLVAPALAARVERPHVAVQNAQSALNRVIEHFGLQRAALDPGIHPSACLHPAADIGKDCCIGAFAVIGRGARVGARCQIHAHAVIEAGAVLGEDCEIHPHAVICSPARIGRRVIVWPGAVVGSEGFGFEPSERGMLRLHHVGAVEVGDDVEIGAGTTVDRGRFGATRLECGVKLDNLVQIGHNCSIGARTVVAAQSGLAGSSRVGLDCMLGGQAGIRDHVVVGDRVLIAAKSGVISDIKKPGQYLGFWVKERRAATRELALIARLPEMARELRALRDEIDQLRTRLDPAERAGGADG